MKTFLLLLCFAVMGNGQALAAMFGDFAVPDALSPRVVATQGGGAATVAVPLDSGSELTLFIPARSEAVREGYALEYIGRNLDASDELALLNLGDRVWIGNRNRLSGGDLYVGYTHKNGLVYPFSFSVASAAAPSTEARQALARIGVFPDLADSGAADTVLSAMEQLDAGRIPEALEALARAEAMLRSPDDPGRRYVELSRAYAHELQGESQAAMERFAKAHAAFPDDVEASTRYFGASGILSEGAAAVKALLDAAAKNPDEPEFLETLGSLYLAYDDMEAATAYFEEALELNPTSGTALLNLAHLHARKADYENSYRRVVNLRYYHPDIPNESLPNLSGKLSEERMRELAGEPLTLGALTAYLRVPDAPAFASQTFVEGSAPTLVEQPAEIIIIEGPVTVIQPPLEVYIPQPYVVHYDTCWWYSWSWWRPSRHWRHDDWDRRYGHRPTWRPHRNSRPPPRSHSSGGRDWNRRDRQGDRRDAAWRSRPDSSPRSGYRIPGRPGTGVGRVRRDGLASPRRNPASIGGTDGIALAERSALPPRPPRRRAPGVDNAGSTGRRNSVSPGRTQLPGRRPGIASTTAAASLSSPQSAGQTSLRRPVARPGTVRTRPEEIRGNEDAPTSMRTVRPRSVPSRNPGRTGGNGVVQPSRRTHNAGGVIPSSPSLPSVPTVESRRRVARPERAQQPIATPAAPARSPAVPGGTARVRSSQPTRQTAPQARITPSGRTQAPIVAPTQRPDARRAHQPRANQPSVRQSAHQPRSRNVAPPQASRQTPRVSQPTQSSTPQIRSDGGQRGQRNHQPPQNDDNGERRRGRRR